jgi:hypothetical protein
MRGPLTVYGDADRCEVYDARVDEGCSTWMRRLVAEHAERLRRSELACQFRQEAERCNGRLSLGLDLDRIEQDYWAVRSDDDGEALERLRLVAEDALRVSGETSDEGKPRVSGYTYTLGQGEPSPSTPKALAVKLATEATPDGLDARTQSAFIQAATRTIMRRGPCTPRSLVVTEAVRTIRWRAAATCRRPPRQVSVSRRSRRTRGAGSPRRARAPTRERPSDGGARPVGGQA